MQFALGKTRVVLLTKTKAIKIARIRPIWVLRRLLTCLGKGEFGERLARYHRNKLQAGLRYVLIGIAVNRQEARTWRKNPSKHLVPTLYSLLFGLVNVQVRGEEVSEEVLLSNHPFRQELDLQEKEIVADMMKAANFCKYNGRVCLLDYGDDDATAIFADN